MSISVNYLVCLTYVITHSTIFHSDEVFATALLKLINPSLQVVRTCRPTEQQLKDLADGKTFCYDIGCQFGYPEYDHHQLDKALRPDGAPYCSFGLLWRDLGSVLCPMQKAWEKVDRDLVLAIDKADNGIEPNTLSAAIHAFNPAWNSKENENDAFWRAEQFAEAVLKQYVANANAEYEAEKLVLESRKENNGKVLILDQYLPWQDTVIEQMPYVLFVMYPSARGGYNVQTVPDAPGSFSGRVLFPQKWLGNPDKALGMTFCHPGNFLTTVDTLEHAVAVANIAINEASKDFILKYDDGFTQHGDELYHDTQWSVVERAKRVYTIDGYETEVIREEDNESVFFSEYSI